MRTLLVLSLAGLLGCPEPPEPPPPGHIDTSQGEVVITVNGEPITQEMVDAVMRRIPEEAVEEMKARGQYDQLVDNMVTGQLLYKQALERGLHQDPEVQRAMAMAEREVLAGELLNQVGEEAITDESVAQMYEEKKVQYQRPSVHARHILVKEKDLAEELKAKLEAGADFAQLAREHSVDSGSAANGGDLGWFEKRRMVRPFAEAAFEAEKGALIGPVETRFGFHVIEVLDKRDATPVEEARPDLEKAIRNEAMETYIEELKAEAEVDSTSTAPEAVIDPMEEVTPPPTPAPPPAGAPPAPAPQGAPE